MSETEIEPGARLEEASPGGEVSGLRKLDYLAMTLRECTSPRPVIDALAVDLVPIPQGRFGYRQMALAESGGVSVMWDGAMKNMGVHVQISGKGCEEIEQMEAFDSWREWIGHWQRRGAKATRIDLAIDDVSGNIAFETVYRQVREGIAMTRAERGRHILDWDSEHDYQTLYVGRRGRDTMMRCYDKGLQLKEGRSWLRFEFEYKGLKADAVATCLVKEGWDNAIGVARSFIEFKDETHEVSRKSRQRPARWWTDLLDASKHVVRLQRDRETSLIKAYGWLRRQAAPILGAIIEAEGGDLSTLVDLAKEGKPRWKDRHRKMVREGLIK